jgi:hypothetical protein
MAGGSKNDKVTAPAKASSVTKVTSPAKAKAAPSPSAVPVWKSPSHRSTAQIRQMKLSPVVTAQNQLLPGWYLHSMLLDGGVEVILISTGNLNEDAYIDPLVKAIFAPGIKVEEVEQVEDPDPINRLGLTGAYFRRKALDNPDMFMNPVKKHTGSVFQRKVFLRQLEDGEETVERRLEALKVIKEFMQREKNNRYHTKVIIQQPGWDMENKNSAGEILKVDSFLQYSQIVRLIKELYENVNNTWALENMETAMCYFTEGYIPFEAHTDLGFPLDKVMPEEPNCL